MGSTFVGSYPAWSGPASSKVTVIFGIRAQAGRQDSARSATADNHNMFSGSFPYQTLYLTRFRYFYLN